MKKVLLFASLIFVAASCTDAGTTENVDKGNHSKYNIERYFYEDGECVYIITRKDSLEVTNVNWTVSHGKTTEQVSAVIDENERPVKVINVYQYKKSQILMENDSIVIIRK